MFDLPPMLEQDEMEEELDQENGSPEMPTEMKVFVKKPEARQPSGMPMGMMKRAGSKAVLNPGVAVPRPKLEVKAPPTIREESTNMLSSAPLLSSSAISEEEETINESNEAVDRQPSNESISLSVSNSVDSNEGANRPARRDSMPRGGPIRQGSNAKRTTSHGGAQATRQGSVSRSGSALGQKQSKKNNVKRKGSVVSTGSRSSSMMRGSSKMSGSMSMRRRSRTDATMITVHTLEGKDEKFVANILNSLVEDFKSNGPNDRSLCVEFDDDAKRWQCPACAKLFVQESNVFAHIQNSHINLGARLVPSEKSGYFSFENKATELQNKIDQVYESFFKTTIEDEDSDIEDDEFGAELEEQMLKLERLVVQDQQPLRGGGWSGNTAAVETAN